MAATKPVAHLLALFDDAVALARFDGHVIVDLNAAFAQLSGHARESLRQQSWLQLNLWLDPAQWEDALARLQANGATQQLQSRLALANGGLAEVSLRHFGLLDEPHYLATVKKRTAGAAKKGPTFKTPAGNHRRHAEHLASRGGQAGAGAAVRQHRAHPAQRHRHPGRTRQGQSH